MEICANVLSEKRRSERLSLNCSTVGEDTDEPMFTSSNIISSCSSNEGSPPCSNAPPFPFPLVQKQRFENPKNILIGHLNVNSLRNKIDSIDLLIKEHIDICLLSETKLDNSFPNQQFHLNGYKLFRKDRDRFGGGIAFYVNETIPCKTLNTSDIPENIELLLLEISLKSRKWIIIGLYKPPSLNEKYFLENLSNLLNRLACHYENIILIGDFNLTVENKTLETFMSTFNFDCLIQKPTCFQSVNPTCIDLILTNKKNIIQKHKCHRSGNFRSS